jgi:transcriptional regulator with XRE-family HTH domain
MGLRGYSDLERGVATDPHYSTLEGIAHALGTTVAELVGEEEPALPLDEVPQETGLIRRAVPDSVGVSDSVKRTLEPQFEVLIYSLKTNGLSKQAAEIERVRDEVLVA